MGLSVVLAFGAVNALLFSPIVMPDGLPAGSLPGVVFSALFLTYYLCYSLLLAEYLSIPALKRGVFLPLLVLALGSVWCVLYFVYGLDDIGCGVLIGSFVLLLYTVARAVKESTLAVLFGLPILCWYAFLVANAILLAVFSV